MGLTTVPERVESSLPKTLESLTKAGFPVPRIFADGNDPSVCRSHAFDGHVTCRWPRVGAWPNWYLGLQELFLRNPNASRYMLCQDDVLFSRNVRGYLDRCRYPDGGSDKYPGKKGWWNLYTVPGQEQMLEGSSRWQPSVPPEHHKGALALVFDRDAVIELLSSRRAVERCLDPGRGQRNIDGGVGAVLGDCGREELVHLPSLCQHQEGETTIPKLIGRAAVSGTFRGEGFDCLSLL